MPFLRGASAFKIKLLNSEWKVLTPKEMFKQQEQVKERKALLDYLKMLPLGTHKVSSDFEDPYFSLGPLLPQSSLLNVEFSLTSSPWNRTFLIFPKANRSISICLLAAYHPNFQV